MRWHIPSYAVIVLMCGVAQAGTVVYDNDQSGFDSAAGSPLTAVNFDDITPGTNIGNTLLAGNVTFVPNGATPIVVKGTDTVTQIAPFTGVVDQSTNKLFPTSGDNVLSPGGTTLFNDSDPSIGNDDFDIRFSKAVKSVGFDLLFQSLDGKNLLGFRILGEGDAVLASGTVTATKKGELDGGNPGGAQFFGVVSDEANIKRILFDDHDSTDGLPNDNVGMDSLRFGAGEIDPTPVPLPAAIFLAPLGFGLALFATRRFNFCRG